MSGVTNFYHFDELDRLVAVSNSLGTSVQHEYDVLDQVTRTIFADQRSLTRAYDNFGNITNRQGVGHPEFVFHFDEIGSLTQKVDGVGRTTELEYDERNRLRRKTYADGTYVEYTYDGVGNVLTRRDPIGRLTSYSYDAGNLTVMVDYENDATIAANYDVLGRLTRLGSQSGTNEWIYDVSGNVVTNIQGRVQAQVVYGYDSEGNRTVMDFDGVRTDYTYDLAGRLESISNNVGLITYVWKSDAKVVDEIQYPGGVSVSNDYDSLLRLMSRHALNPTGGVAASVVYELDDGGLRTNAAFADGRSVSFSYDELRQITNVTGRLAGGGMDTNYLFSYSYDPAGNFTRSIGNQLQTDFAVNLLNQYTQTVENQGAVLTNLFMYDVGGNLLDDGRNQYEWDEENRLLAVSNGVHRMEFVYNASGFRVESRTFLGAAQQDLRRFVYDGALPIAEVDESNQVLNRYTYGLDLAFALNGAEAPALRPANAGGIGSLLAGTDAVSTNLQFYFYDGNGNVIGLVDEHGVVAASYEYDPFGVALSASGPAAESNPYRFSSKYLEGTYGLAYYGHRYYAPSLGRWLNRDPAEELSAMPTYAFVANNPVNSIDWFGLFDWTTIVSKKADTFSAGDDFPGVFGQAVASIPAGAFGVTVPELSVQAECCECTLVGWQLCDDGFTIIYTIETWFNSNFDAPLSGLFPDFTPEVFEWAQRAEDDHVKDLKRWEKEGRKVAKEIEEMLVDEGEWFLFEEDCREKAEDKLKKVLGPSLIAARSKSVKKWDDFTKNPNHFFSSPWRRP
jgi:RHS repeat-associated protein